MDAIYVDRYGPSGPPRWLVGCHGECEALGWYPISCQHQQGEAQAIPDVTDCTVEDCDGWPMVRCSECHGTGRATRAQVVARLPRYVIRGVRAMRWMLLSREGWRTYRAPWVSRSGYIRVALKAAWS